LAASTATEQHVGLKANAVSLWGDFVVSIANVAPSSSVAYTLALLVAFAGHVAPLAVLVTGVAMFFCATGYASLNRWRAHAGAPYVWVSEAVSPKVGAGTGFLNVFVSTFANVGNITLAGAYLLVVLFPTRTFSSFVTWLVAAAVMGILVYLSIRGIRPAVWLQTGLIVIEYSAMISFVVLALIHESSGGGGATLPSVSDFTISHAVAGVGGFKGLAEAAVPCGFLYLGWEATAVLGEESTRRNINPGRAMLLGTGFLTLWYTFLIVVFQGVASEAKVLANGANVLAYAGTLLVPGFLGRALPLAVLIAVIGTCQIQMIEPSRILFAMARDRIIPRVFGLISKAHQTPWAGLLILAAIPPILLIPYLASTSASHAIGYIISADGMFGLFMYFVIAVSSVWFYRAYVRRSVVSFLVMGVLPLLGGLFMGAIFFYGLTTQTAVVAWVSVIGVALAFAIGAFVVWRAAPTAPFFTEIQERRRVDRMGGSEAEAAEAEIAEAEEV
jgi:amino acid transporter